MAGRLYVDFNEMLAPDEVLLSEGDSKLDSNGDLVTFSDGIHVQAYSDDMDDTGAVDNLIAEGVAFRNRHEGWSERVKWVLKIGPKGIRHESEDR